MKLIHLTDTHFVKRGERLYGLDPQERLVACIADINRHHADADHCIITGDLTHWGEAEAYALLRDCLTGLVPPVTLVIGNHDHRPTLLRHFPTVPVDPHGYVQQAFDTPEGRFLVLDTNEPGSHAGWYCERRQEWLARQLSESDGAIFLFMHHPPFDIGIRPLDRIGLRQAADFQEIVEPFAHRIRHLFFGHVHRPVGGSWLGIPVSTVRATNHQCWLDFDAAGDGDIAGSHEPPAYAVVLVDADRVIVHPHDFLYAGPRFGLGERAVADSRGAPLPAAE
ncbi:phosphodiesterase [Marinibaculum pumilum]|uniref:Phosphodiesterase n=1 Tax=Marinibaculum pumilum TaxID=1766165 RepID=A0ABV7KYZ2_9PROT